MIEVRQQIEKNYYNRKAEEVFKKDYKNFNWQYGSKGFGPVLGTPFRFTERKIKEIVDKNKVQGRTVHFLDYGCGTGVHSIFPAKLGAIAYGIDISDKLIKIANEWVRREGVGGRAKFSVMDCEKLEFPDNFFDIVFNCGTLPCLDRKKAYREIVRVLKPDGCFISVDTLGHNPLLNLVRKIKLIRGLKTQHTYNNILKMEDVDEAKQYFKETEVLFFNLTTLLAIPFQKLPGFNSFLKFLEAVDKKISKTFFKKYSFKVVFIFSQPQK